MHLEVAALLRRPFTGRILGTWRDPNLPRAKMDEDHEVNVDQSFESPLLLASEVALPKRVGVAFEKLVPGVRMIARRWSKTSLDDHVLHRLTRNVNAHATELLQDLGIAEAGLFRVPNEESPVRGDQSSLIVAHAAGILRTLHRSSSIRGK